MNRRLYLAAKTGHNDRFGWLNPNRDTSDDFSNELAIVKLSGSTGHQAPHDAFKWIAKQKAERLLKHALDRFAPLTPHYAWGDEPFMLTSPHPHGAGNRIGLLFEKTNGVVRVAGTNWMNELRAGSSSSASCFFAQFDGLSTDDQRNNLIREAICSAITSDNLEWVDRVEREGRRYWTMPIFLLVLDGANRWLYCTTAVVDGRPSANTSLECFGEVKS